MENALQPGSADLQLWGAGLNQRTSKAASVELTKVQVPGARHLTKLVNIVEIMADYEWRRGHAGWVDGRFLMLRTPVLI